MVVKFRFEFKMWRGPEDLGGWLYTNELALQLLIELTEEPRNDEAKEISEG